LYSSVTPPFCNTFDFSIASVTILLTWEKPQAWNYQTGSVLRRFILPLSPLTLALDPADRAFYVGFEDGTVQCVDLHSANGDAFSTQLSTNKLFVEESRNVPVTVTGDGTTPDERARWVSAGHDSAITAISVMYEGNFVVTGNEKGEVCVWDVATGSLFRKIVQRKSKFPLLVEWGREGKITA